MERVVISDPPCPGDYLRKVIWNIKIKVRIQLSLKTGTFWEKRTDE
jgi:hypothetical protein